MVKVVFFKEVDGSTPLINWLDKQRPKRVQAKCLAMIRLLAEIGHELHRPYSDTLRDGIRELRIRVANVNYRLLYFFCGSDCVVLTHGISKEGRVPDVEIERALQMKQIYEKDPQRHSYIETERYYDEKS